MKYLGCFFKKSSVVRMTYIILFCRSATVTDTDLIAQIDSFIFLGDIRLKERPIPICVIDVPWFFEVSAESCILPSYGSCRFKNQFIFWSGVTSATPASLFLFFYCMSSVRFFFPSQSTCGCRPARMPSAL